MDIHSAQYKHAYNNIPSGTSQVILRVPANTTNTAGIISFIQPQAQVNDFTSEKLENAFFPVSNYQSVDLRVNTKSIYEERLEDFAVSDLYHQIAHLFPRIKNSRAITASAFAAGNEFVLCQSLSGAPRQFRHALMSGIQSSRLNIDMGLRLEFTAPLAATMQVDSFVLSEVKYSFANGMITLSE